jgi:hypothetical protein
MFESHRMIRYAVTVTVHLLVLKEAQTLHSREDMEEIFKYGEELWQAKRATPTYVEVEDSDNSEELKKITTANNSTTFEELLGSIMDGEDSKKSAPLFSLSPQPRSTKDKTLARETCSICDWVPGRKNARMLTCELCSRMSHLKCAADSISAKKTRLAQSRVKENGWICEVCCNDKYVLFLFY